MASVFASATRTQAVATYNSDIVLPPEARGAWFHLDITAVGTTPTLDIKLQAYDDVTGSYEDITDSAGTAAIGFTQKSGTGEDTMKVYPGCVERLGAVTHRQYNIGLPRKVRVVATVGDAGGDTITFSLAYRPLW